MIVFTVRIINLLGNALILLVIVDAVLSFFMSPYHPVRTAIGRIINPLLNPIRRVVPLIGAIDLSPLILIILIEILIYALSSFLYAL